MSVGNGLSDTAITVQPNLTVYRERGEWNWHYDGLGFMTRMQVVEQLEKHASRLAFNRQLLLEAAKALSEEAPK